MNETVFSVEQFNQYVKAVFDAEELLHRIRITGEVSNFGLSGKNAFFVLKDESAQVACTLFGYSGAPLRDGEKVILCGTANYYVRGGKLSFNVSSIEKAGDGDLYRNFLELKAKLDKEGLFDNKIEMPSVIRRIGVITSATGAVIHDIVNIVSRRDPTVDIVLFPVKVQGIGAEEEIAKAISKLDMYRKVDVIVIARGGGSMEDLAAFNSETVARTVSGCDKFVMSAVGHETDYTLCDFCADMRAPTPSAAAEMLTTDIRQRRLALVRAVNNNLNALTDRYNKNQTLFKDAVADLATLSIEKINSATARVADRLYHMNDAASRKWLNMRQEVRESLQRLEFVNPSKILQNGYSAVLSMHNERIKDAKTVSVGDTIRVLMQNGSLQATVDVVDIMKESI